MRYDRDKILSEFLQSSEIRSRLDLSNEDIANIDFSRKTDEPIIESLKALIMSFCNNDTQSVILRKTNMQIEKFAGQTELDQDDNK